MRLLSLGVFALTLPLLLGGCSQTLNQAPVHVASPISEIDGATNLSRDGRFYFAGQPSPDALRELANRGVVKVINLRTEEEMTERVDFDEAEVVDSLGMTYVHMTFPREGRDEWLEEFITELGETRGPVLIHCASSGRVGGVWGRYLRVKRGFSADDAVLRGQAAGLGSESLTEWVRSPVPARSYR